MASEAGLSTRWPLGVQRQDGGGEKRPWNPFWLLSIVCLSEFRNILQRGQFRILKIFGSLKLSVKIGILFSFCHLCSLSCGYLILRKASLGRWKVPHNGHWYSKLLLVELVRLVRNALEEGPQFLNIKPTGSQKRGHPQSILVTDITFLRGFSL